jgi:hypothetical protein
VGLAAHEFPGSQRPSSSTIIRPGAVMTSCASLNCHSLMELIGCRQNEMAVVTRLRVRASDIDPIRTRFCIANLFNNAYAQPTGLSPAAIVFVRRLTDPLPGSLQLRSHQLNPPVAWQRALTVALDQSLTNAARPGLAVVPAAANSVVFSDRSELLACLASDWCESRIATHWWWQSFLKKADAEQVVWNLWRSSPEYVPVALEHLGRWGKAVHFIRALGDAPAYELLRAVAGTFGLNKLISVLDYAPGSERSQFKTSEDRDYSRTSLVRHEVREVFAAGQPLAPWRSLVPESLADGLGVGQQLLLGIGLMLDRAPAKVRASEFAREVDHWRREIAARTAIGFVLKKPGNDEDRAQRSALPGQSRDLAIDSSPSSINKQSRPQSFVWARQDPSITPDAQMFPSNQPTDHSSGDAALSEIEIGFAASLAETSNQPLTTAKSDLHESSSASDEKLKFDRQSQTAAAAANSDQLLIEAPTETQFGGVFYLINLALYLGLYGDFTTPAEPGIELNVWDFVALLGRELAGEQFENDPLWALLARLAGREEEGLEEIDFRPGDDWRMPQVWLEPFSEGSFKHATDCGRLLVFHSGFLVIDVPLEITDAETQLQRELTAYEDFDFPVTALASEDLFPEKDLTRRRSDVNASFEIDVWLDRLMPYVRARLQKALGLADAEDPSAVVCRLSARVCVTPTHIDVFFTLTELPVEVRRAGLDRNPGWVPAAGRFITFHFE